MRTRQCPSSQRDGRTPGRGRRDRLNAHHHHIRLWRSLPDVEGELGALERAEFDPRMPQYWERDTDESQWSARLTHRIKTMYGFYSLLESVEQPTVRQQATSQFGYLMA